MRAILRRYAARQHLLVAVVGTWLLATSPWVSMLSRMPRNAGWLEQAHVGLGFVALLVAVVYLLDCLRAGRRELYFPWLTGRFAQIASDLRGLLRGRIPAAEGGGLFGAIEGLTLVALLAAGLTGAAWYFSQGTADAMAWRGHHILAARVFGGLFVAHVVTVGLHVLDFVRD